MKARLPSPALALTAHIFLAAGLGIIAVKSRDDALLYALVVPVLIAPLVYPRVIALAMLFTSIAASGLVVHALRVNAINSVRTILILAPGLLGVVEILYRVKSQRDRIDAAMREGDRRFRALIEKSSDGIVLFDATGTVLYSSPAITQMLGYQTAEVVGKNILSHVHESDSAAVSKQMGPLLRHPGATVSVQLRRQHKNGSWVWVEATVTNLLAEPSVRAAVVNYRDITERKRAETRIAIFSSLAQKLAATTTPTEAGRMILDGAQELFGWDAGFLHLYSPATDCMVPILTIDLLDGRKTEVSPSLIGMKPTPMSRCVLEEGPRLILRSDHPEPAPSLTPIGNKSRRSASLMFVPIRDGEKAVGIVSIQSYSPNAYTPEDLQTLQALANHGAGALARIQEAAERQRAEEELRLSETRFRTVVENIGEGLVITDLEDVVLYANSRITELCGFAPEEMIGRRAYELIVPAPGWDALQRKNERRAEGITERYELVLKRKDGARFWSEIIAAPYRSPDGEIIGTIAAVKDITERKQSEIQTTAFSALGQQLSATNTPEDAARIIVDVAQDLFGWDACVLDLYLAELDIILPLISMDTIDGQRVSVPNPFSGKPPSPIMRRVIREGRLLILRGEGAPEPRELKPFGDAQRKSASLMFVPIQHGKRVIGSISIQSYTDQAYTEHDLNTLQALADHCAGALERLRAVEELRRSEERFSKAFQSSPLPIAITNLRDERFLDVNDSLERLLGYRRDQIIGRTAGELDIWVEAEQHHQLQQALAQHQPVRELGCKLRTSQGDVRDVLASAEPFELGGEPCMLLISQDITERLNLEAQLRHSQKMEAVGQLSAGVAHDFNNILTIIQGHINLLSGLPNLDAEAKESMEHIAGASERATNLTAQLLAFSRKRMMQSRQVDLSEVVTGAGRMLRGLLGERIDLQLAYPGHLPYVNADIGMIEQVIINLALNARDAMSTGGKLVISLSALQTDETHLRRNPEARLGQFVRMSFEDTGCGMDAEILNRIFEPFFTTKEVGKGSGLGLATVYGIVKQHQGWIEVESRVGSGTTFKIYLPCASDFERRTAQPPTTEKAQGGTETILVVEDEPALRELVKKILKIYGYHVLAAANGRQALEVWREHRDQIDLLLTDLVMPEEPTGMDLAKRLKEERACLKIIYTSGYSIDLKAHSPILREGVNFLAKPFNPPTLAATVRKCLDAEQG